LSRFLGGNPLVGLNRVLDLQGPATGGTILEDETLVQTFETNVSVARSRTVGFNQGRYAWTIENTHDVLGNDFISNAIQPWDEDTAGIRRNSWPLPVDPRLFEIWIKGFSAARISGDATLADASFWSNPDNNYIGLATVGASEICSPLGFSDAEETGRSVVSATRNALVWGDGSHYVSLNYRLPVGSQMVFVSVVGVGTVIDVIQLNIDVLLLPIGTTPDGG